MKKLNLLAILALFMSSSVHAAAIQWSSADGGNDHWYELVTTNMTVGDARANALSKGGYLTTITSQAEQDFILTLFDGNYLNAWIGLSDQAAEGTWSWMDGPEAGQAATYTNWAPREPNDYSTGEDYASMNWWKNGSGNWNDWGAPAFPHVKIASVVEYTVPEPSVVALLGLGLIGFGFARRKVK